MSNQDIPTETPSENALNEEQKIQSIVDRSIQSAMSNMHDSIAQSVVLALTQNNPQVTHTALLNTPSDTYWSAEDSTSHMMQGFKKPGKASHKRHHTHTGHSHSKKIVLLEDQGESSKPPTKTKIPPSDKRSLKIPSAREELILKRVKLASKRQKPDSFRTSSSNSSADENSHSEAERDSDYEDISETEEGVPLEKEESKDTIIDGSGDPYFNPEQIKHPRSGEWVTQPIVTKFLSLWIQKPLEKNDASKLRAECPRPSLPKKLANTPELDPTLVKFLLKSGKHPKKGVDRSYRFCQDKLLDLLGPLAKILDLIEEAVSSNSPIDLAVLKGWAQRAIVMFGNANAAISSERRRSILMKLDPQLMHLASSQPPSPTDGLLFGDSFIKEINKYVSLFTSLDKAQSSLKKVFQPKIFTRAGKRKGRFPSRSSNEGQYTRGPPRTEQSTTPTNTYQQSPFFPQRGRPWRARGQRGFPRSRPSSV